MIETTILPKLTCERCSHVWIPVKPLTDVKICPACKRTTWNVPKKDMDLI